MSSEGDAPAVEAHASAGLRRVAGLSTAAMLLLCWPLWVVTGGDEVPRVPFVRALPEWPTSVSWAAFAALVGSVAMAGLARRWRGWYAASIGLLVLAVLKDQHRFQPWAYQYAVTGLLLAAMRGGEGLRYVRWWFVALYAHSGLSKLDASFLDGLGPVFLRAAVGPMGLDPSAWPPFWRVGATLAMPAFETLVAVALAVPAWRLAGRAGAVALHLTLLAVLGPLGLGHSTVVLVWNAATLLEVWVAFGPEVAPGRETERAGGVAALARLVFWAGVVLPFGERWEFFDAWPSHALYASHVGRTAVWLHEADLPGYPPVVRRHVGPPEGPGPWRRLDLTGWSRESRGTPVYPQRRACLGLAEGVVRRYGARGLVRVVVSGPADLRTGARRSAEAVGLDAVRAMGRGFLLNAHPARGGGAAGRGFFANKDGEHG